MRKQEMRCSISNIAWDKTADEAMYDFMGQNGFQGLEIAPSRLFGEHPYACIEEASAYARRLEHSYGIEIVSMQSIWYGRGENLFSSEQERDCLMAYTKQAIAFAAAIGCKNLVFGCPRNRRIGQSRTRESALAYAAAFFSKLGEMAAENGVRIAIEANPAIYGTDFLNTTEEAAAFLHSIAQVTNLKPDEGLSLNLDLGTMIYHQESMEWLSQQEKTAGISHVHISEPLLNQIQQRALHKEVIDWLMKRNYRGYFSIEMGKRENLQEVKDAMLYVKGLFEEIDYE